MKFGVSLGAANPRGWVEITEAADRLGFESVWMPEHLVLPVHSTGSPVHGEDQPPVPSTVPVFDVFTYFGYLAGRTHNVRFGTHVYNIGLRHPFTVARSVATLDQLSGGRFEFGIGASWLREEWDAVGLDFTSRGRRVDETLLVCRRLWDEPEVEHHGEFFSFEPVNFEPKPIQRPAPKVHVGGDSKAALRRAALMGDGWIPMNHDLEELPRAIEGIRTMRVEAGIDDHIEVTVGGRISSPEEVARYHEAGVDRVLVVPWTRSREAVESLGRFAEEVIAPLAEATS